MRAEPYEQLLWSQGYQLVGGVDEVGAGALYGPLIACCVVFRPGELPEGLRDSKRLTPARREALWGTIRRTALAVGLGEAAVREVDELGPARASHLAMVRAVQAVTRAVGALEWLLVDYHQLDLPVPQIALPRLDAHSPTVAAASIVAKVERDRLIQRLAQEEDPAYDLMRNKGYGTARHRLALKMLGPTVHHRRTFIRRILRGTDWVGRV